MNSIFKKGDKKGRGRRRPLPQSDSARLNKYSPPSSSRRRSREQLDRPSSSKRAKSKRFRLAVRIITIFVLSVGVAAVVWSNLRIKTITFNSPQERDKYELAINKYLDRNPVADFKPLISIDKIRGELLEAFPELAEVKITVPVVGDSLIVDLTERNDRLVLKTGDGDYFIVDQNGFAYERYDPSKGLDGVLVLEDNTNVQYHLDTTKQLISPSLVSTIQDINKGLSSLSTYKDQTFRFKITDEARVIYAVPSKTKYTIKFQQNESIAQQLANLKDALAYMKKKGIAPQQYIDVRVNGTTYYK